MKEILENLNRSVGCLGSAVMTGDGIVVSSAINGSGDSDTLAAVMSSLVIATQKSLKGLGDSVLQTMVINSSRGRITLVNAGRVYLLVITDAGIQPDATMLDIKSAIHRLNKMISLYV
jgi:predicted regulator of Ras-like GTPase activity (Roadblock/LC7/MglB family)